MLHKIYGKGIRNTITETGMVGKILKVITDGLADGKNAIIMFSLNFGRCELLLWFEQGFEGFMASAMN